MSLRWLTIAQIEQGVTRLNFSAFGWLTLPLLSLSPNRPLPFSAPLAAKRERVARRLSV